MLLQIKVERRKMWLNLRLMLAVQEITINRFDIHVGLIKKVEKHPKADSLYVYRNNLKVQKFLSCDFNAGVGALTN
ncbi:putative nucleic acid-binding protein [Helianthus annuus]|nr:putative nucleic acid-binding protein [Helianthus annuus]